MADIKELEKKLGVSFNEPQLLETALTHRSFINEAAEGEHNERLEFLGDAVLELVVTEHLYRNYSEPEGVLTNWRSALVKTASLSQLGSDLGLIKYVKLGKGEAKGLERARQQILANTVEALIGALYLDQGYEAPQRFITQQLLVRLPHIIEHDTWLDAKTKLQESAQEKEGLTPHYKVLEESGPDHDKVFVVGVYIGDTMRGRGRGSSKQAAQQAAAAAALKTSEAQ